MKYLTNYLLILLAGQLTISLASTYDIYTSTESQAPDAEEQIVTTTDYYSEDWGTSTEDTSEDYWTEFTTESPTETEAPLSGCCGLIPDDDTSEPPTPEVTTEETTEGHHPEQSTHQPSELPSSSTEDKWRDTTTRYHTPEHSEDTTDSYTDDYKTTPGFTGGHKPRPSRPTNTETWTKVYTEKFSTILPNGRRIWISISTSVRAILRIFGIGK